MRVSMCMLLLCAATTLHAAPKKKVLKKVIKKKALPQAPVVKAAKANLFLKRKTVKPHSSSKENERRALARTGKIEGGGTGTLVIYNPTGSPGADGYKESAAILGCLTAAHIPPRKLTLPNGKSAQPCVWGLSLPTEKKGEELWQGRRKNADGDLLPMKEWEKQNKEKKEHGCDWRFYELVTENQKVTPQNVQMLLGGDVDPYRLEHNGVGELDMDSKIHNVFYLNKKTGGQTGQQRENDRKLVKMTKKGLLQCTKKLGVGASGSPVYDSEWNRMIAINRGGDKSKKNGPGFFTPINAVIKGVRCGLGLKAQLRSALGII